jgi:uncharacterized membrane protein
MVHGYRVDEWHMVWGGVLMLLFWLSVIGLTVWGLRHLFASTPHTPRETVVSPRSPLEIAQSRYAKGEISREDYLVLIEDLKQHHTEEK